MRQNASNLAFIACVFCWSSSSFSAFENITGHIGGLSNQAREDIGNVPGNRYNGNFRFDYNKEVLNPDSTDVERRVTFEALVNDQSLTMFSLREAYLGFNLTSKDHFRLGRQVLNWSPIDQQWGFGKLNNRRNFDYFDPGQEGLIGLLYERRSSNGMRYRVFASGLYVPELNPSLDIDKKDKTITSRHPWADVPERTADIDQVGVKRIAYEVDYPEYQDVVYRYSIGANLGFESKHWVLDNFIIRKPENTISPKVTVNLDTIADVVNAKITPQFFYHDVMGSTLKYRNLDLEMFVSGISIKPKTFPDGDQQATNFTDIKTEKINEDYLGGGIQKTNDIYGIGAGYVARLSPYQRKSDNLSLDPRWNQAVNFFLMRNLGDSFSLSGDIKYDMLTTDRLLMLKALYKATKSMHLSIGMNLIGSPAEGKSFWSPYTNNDMVYGAMRYVF